MTNEKNDEKEDSDDTGKKEKKPTPAAETKKS